MIKLCSKCKENKQHTPKGKMCQDCNKEYQQIHYVKNKAKYLDKAYSNRSNKIQFVWAILSQSICLDCGETDPIVLEFDHVRGIKEGNVTDLARNQASTKRILEEIEKCEIVCANCHKRRTYLRCNSYRNLAPLG